MKKLKKKHLQELATLNQNLTEETQQNLEGKGTETKSNMDTAPNNYNGTSDYDDDPYAGYYGGGSYTGDSDYDEENLSTENSTTMSWKKFEVLKYPTGELEDLILRFLRNNPFIEWTFGTIVDKMNEHLNKFKLKLKGKADERYNITLTTKCYISGTTHLYFVLQAKYYDKEKKSWVTTEESKTDLFS